MTNRDTWRLASMLTPGDRLILKDGTTTTVVRVDEEKFILTLTHMPLHRKDTALPGQVRMGLFTSVRGGARVLVPEDHAQQQEICPCTTPAGTGRTPLCPIHPHPRAGAACA